MVFLIRGQTKKYPNKTAKPYLSYYKKKFPLDDKLLK